MNNVVQHPRTKRQSPAPRRDAPPRKRAPRASTQPSPEGKPDRIFELIVERYEGEMPMRFRLKAKHRPPLAGRKQIVGMISAQVFNHKGARWTPYGEGAIAPGEVWCVYEVSDEPRT